MIWSRKKCNFPAFDTSKLWYHDFKGQYYSKSDCPDCTIEKKSFWNSALHPGPTNSERGAEYDNDPIKRKCNFRAFDASAGILLAYSALGLLLLGNF